MLKVKSLSLKIGNFALKNISFALESGKTHVLIGKTGSGKTLLLETIVGFNQNQKGEIIIFNKNSENLAIENRNIAYLPQDLALFPHLNVKENIFYSPSVKGNIPQNISFSKQLIEATGIGHLLNRKIKNLSGGEKQRVALVRALMSQSKLVVLDEPFSAIDQNTKHKLHLLLKKLQEEFNFSILSVTHDLEEAFFLADTISIMSEGRILQTATKKELYQNPISAEVASFLGVSNIFDGLIEQINQNSILVSVQELAITISSKKQLELKKHLKKGQKVKFGFRKNEVSVLRNQKAINEVQNAIITKVILIIEKISCYEILLETKKTQSRILIEIPNSIFKNSKISLNQTLIFSINLENIFIFER